MREHVHICEVGPRDGLQMAKTRMASADKLRWIAALHAAGLPEIEVGSFVPARVIPQLADTPEVLAEARKIPGLAIMALAPNLRGAQAAYHAEADAIEVPVSVTEGHSRANLNRTPEESVAEIRRIADFLAQQPARPGRARPPLIVGLSCAFGCSIDGVVPAGKAVDLATRLAEAGADAIMLADTVGYAHPAQVKSLVRATRAAIGGKLRGLHLHDTMGIGLANALAGLEEGIRCFDSSQAGLGGCPYAPGASGNIVTEDLVFMLESMGFETGIDLEKLLAARALLAQYLPGEPLHGGLAKAGIPKTFRAAA
jgi:hydroxymethylglutaryl-CoA lyase